MLSSSMPLPSHFACTPCRPCESYSIYSVTSVTRFCGHPQVGLPLTLVVLVLEGTLGGAILGPGVSKVQTCAPWRCLL